MASIREKIRDLFYFICKIAAPSKKKKHMLSIQGNLKAKVPLLLYLTFFLLLLPSEVFIEYFFKFIFSSSVSILHLSCQAIWILMFSSFEEIFLFKKIVFLFFVFSSPGN